MYFQAIRELYEAYVIHCFMRYYAFMYIFIYCLDYHNLTIPYISINLCINTILQIDLTIFR